MSEDCEGHGVALVASFLALQSHVSVEFSPWRGWRKSLDPSLPRPHRQLRRHRAGLIPV